MVALPPDTNSPTYDAPPRPCRYGQYDYCRRPAEPGYKSCRPCRVKRSERQERKRQRRIAAGRCAYNGCPRPPLLAHLCPEHHEAAKERNRQRRERFRAAGLCFQCGHRPPIHGYSLCWSCRVKHQGSKQRAKESGATTDKPDCATADFAESPALKPSRHRL